MTYLPKKLLRVSLAAKAIAIAAIVLLACLGLLVPVRWKERGKVLRVGYSQFAPYVIVNEAGQPDGLAVEMVRRAARVSGVPIRWVLVPGEIDAALKNGEIDLYPLLTLTDKRKKNFSYSQPWWENEIGLISLQDHPLRTNADASGKRVAIRGLPVLKALAEKLFPKTQLVIVPKMENMIGALCNGDVDGFFLDLRLLESQLLKALHSAPAAHSSSPPFQTVAFLWRQWLGSRNLVPPIVFTKRSRNSPPMALCLKSHPNGRYTILTKRAT